MKITMWGKGQLLKERASGYQWLNTDLVTDYAPGQHSHDLGG